jgi:lipooligosaccharide transport system permease protein
VAVTRIVPSVLLDIRRPQRLVERSVMVNRRAWMMVFSGFFEPLFYLFSIRIGLGSLVGDLTVNGQTIPYDEFVAPGLLAAAAMNGAIFESTMNVFHKWKAAKLYDSLLATPLTSADIALGEIAWSMIRGLMYSGAFLLTMAALGMVNSPWVVMALPASVLIGFAFSAVGMACTTYMRSWADFEYVPALTLPLFLFSTAFYPLST